MNNLEFSYFQATNMYEKLLPLDNKKNNGIFYTDIFLANKILKNLSISKEDSILDPCCGTGSFLFSAYQQGYENIFGADIDKKSIDISKKYVPNGKFIQIDTLGNSYDKVKNALKLQEVDCIIGNPPYAVLNSQTILNADENFLEKINISGNNLFIAALFRAFDLVKNGGLISYIIPKNFLHIDSYSNLRKCLLKNKTILEIVDIGQYFNNVRGEQIILTLKNSAPPNEHKIILKKLIFSEFVNTIEIKQSFYENEIMHFQSKIEQDIFVRLKKSFCTLADICKGYIGRGKFKNSNSITGKDIRKFGYKNYVAPKSGNQIFIQNIYSAEAGIIAAFGGNLQASETVTILTDSSPEMCKYLLGVLHSKVCNFYLQKFCYNNSKLTMHSDAKYLKQIPLNIKDKKTFSRVIAYVEKLEMEEYLSSKWYDLVEKIDNLMYETYGFDLVQRDFIELSMKQRFSSRWYKNGK
ncbi:MAG: N-6 DNA methylase [Elusimicrobiota bacterium]|jgi:tRNA1(Val) A37 N6-methylase TrmN6|nr:N-6 DNA methylase [Elusimicrobiota bacterium]